MYANFDRNKLLYTSQCRFRKLHSTELASLELVDRVRLDMDSGKTPVSIFLDLSNAFDTSDHSILLLKLTHYGLPQAAIRWFSSYLFGRRQLVDFNGTWSTITSTSTGVPQRSILEPLLFIIYMNDIHVASEKFNSVIYADDTSLLSSLCSFSVISRFSDTCITVTLQWLPRRNQGSCCDNGMWPCFRQWLIWSSFMSDCLLIHTKICINWICFEASW